MCLILVLEMVTVPNTPRSSNQDSSVDVELDTNYLKMAKKGGGHKGKLINQDCALAVSVSPGASFCLRATRKTCFFAQKSQGCALRKIIVGSPVLCNWKN